jgi:tryptophan 2,3-dioxygenase
VRKLVAKDYSVPVLDGPGDTDYARYMRTDALLSLQRRPDQMVHRDELLFQTVHQTTELWLKHAAFEVEEAARRIRRGALEEATLLLNRGSLGIELVTGQLEMLRHLAPWDFQTVRTVLGHGSGFESPGWRALRRVSQEVADAFDEHVATTGVDLAELYRGSPADPVYRLTEAMIEWDERIAVWRIRHYKIATRIIGHEVVGTKGTPVDVLVKLINQKFFPELWRVRTELTRTGPMGEAADGQAADGQSAAGTAASGGTRPDLVGASCPR